MEAATQRCCTSNFVLDETFTLLARRASYPFAARRATSLLSSGILEILRTGPDDELAALRYFEKFADQKISYTDCVSFVLMKGRNLRQAFAFDHHFAYAGFELWPAGGETVHEPPAAFDP